MVGVQDDMWAPTKFPGNAHLSQAVVRVTEDMMAIDMGKQSGVLSCGCDYNLAQPEHM